MLNFIRIFISLVLFITLFSANSYSEVVKKIDVKGNERISAETIAIFGDISVGKNYEISDINSLIKKLYDTTFFSNISVVVPNSNSNNNISVSRAYITWEKHFTFTVIIILSFVLNGSCHYK